MLNKNIYPLINRTIIIFLSFFVQIAFAQDKFTAQVSKNPVGVGEQFELTYTINTDGGSFQAPSFKDFNVLMGPSQSSSMQIINGVVSQSVSVSYVLAAKAEGTFTIAAASINSRNKTITSNSISLKVVKGSPKSATNGSNNEGDEDVMNQIAKNLYIKATVSKTDVFQGEAITISYKLFSRVSLVNLNLSKMPTMTGFWSQDLDSPKQLELRREIINGVEYNVADLKKIILFPQYSGKLTIDGMEAESVVRVQSRQKRGRSRDPFDDIFNDPFFGRTNYQDIPYQIKSEKIKINVKALPSPSPDGFAGAVGDLRMEASIDNPSTKTNESVTLKIKISGSGNLKLIDPIKLDLPSDIESYEPKTIDKISVSNQGVTGSRTFEYLLIPRVAGEYKIGSIAFAYFNPASKSFKTSPTALLTLKVAKGANDPVVTQSSSSNKADVKLLGSDIRFIKTQMTEPSSQFYFWGSWLFYLLLIIPLGLALTAGVYAQKIQKENANISFVKSKKATQIALKRLKNAKVYLKNQQKDLLYEEIAKSIWGYLSDKLEIPLAELSKDTVSASLAAKHVDAETIDKLNTLTDYCSFVRYAPSMATMTLEEVYQDAVSSITLLEQQINRPLNTETPVSVA